MENIIKILKEGTYKPESQIFKNMNRSISFGDYKPFSIENKLSKEEKIEIIDKYSDGLATYMLTIINKWNDEKDSLPKDSWGYPKTISKKAWIKRNDQKKIIDNEYRIGDYWMFGSKFKDLSIQCPTTEYGRNMEHTGQHVVNQWFYDFCYKQLQEEQKWFKEHDSKQIKITQVKNLGDHYGTVFGCKLLNDIVWNNKKTDITDEQLDAFINAYEALKKCITEQTEILTEKLGADAMYKEEE